MTPRSSALFLLLGSAAITACPPAPPPDQPPASTAPPAPPPTAKTTASASAKPTAAPSVAAADEPEGDESIVGLLGTYRITVHVAASVSALSEKEAAATHGRDVVIRPALESPWDKCPTPKWTHKEVKVEAWLQSWNAPTLTVAQRKALGLKEATLTLWEAACGAQGPRVEVAQPRSGDTIVLLHDGVAFAAARRGL